jgi:hypothetical protein
MKISFLPIIILLSVSSIPLSAQTTTGKDTALIKQHFNNKKEKKGNNNLFSKKDIEKRMANTIVVINKKIYTVDAKEYRLINREDIISLEVIKDESSATQIKNIIIIQTKEKIKKDD